MTLIDPRHDAAVVLPLTAPAAAAPARTLIDLFDAAAAAHPEAVALDAGARITYTQLREASLSVAAELRTAGVGPGDRVGIRVASGTADLYVSILGVLRAGAAYVPVDADDPDARAEQIWRASGACALISDAGLERLLPAAPRATPFPDAPSPSDDAWIIFTSGSTGTPKGVAVTHRSAAAFADAEARLWTVAPTDRVLAGLSVGFDASCEEMWLAWRHGAALVPAPRHIVRAGAELGPWLAEHAISVVSTVPTLAALWDDAALAGVRLLILGGEALPDELAERLVGDDAREVWNTYGPTEATVVTTAARVRPGRPVTIGRALDGWETAVVDERGEPVERGVTGELVVGGVGLARYLDARLDAERYAPLPALGWSRAYRTGDRVRETPDGYAFAGRADDQVKINGRRLELGEVEALLRGAPGVDQAAAAVRRSPAGNAILVGYVTGVPGAEPVDGGAVRAAVAERLPTGVVPVIVVLDELPIASSGKTDRRALPWPPPETTPQRNGRLSITESLLADAWRDQLGPVALHAGSDFFALGGTSVAVAKLVSGGR